jgi:hypothetical protein
MDPVGHRPEIEDKGGIRFQFVELIEQGNLWIKAVFVAIELRKGFGFSALVEPL